MSQFIFRQGIFERYNPLKCLWEQHLIMLYVKRCGFKKKSFDDPYACSNALLIQKRSSLHQRMVLTPFAKATILAHDGDRICNFW